MKKMKKIGSLFASIAMFLCLAACSNNTSQGSGNVTHPHIQSSPSATSGTSSAKTSSSKEESSALENTSVNSSKSTENITESSNPVESSESVITKPAAPVQSESQSNTDPAAKENKTLVVYFTWSSNTAGMAETIANLTGGDTFEIVPVKPYPKEYTPCTEVALEERDNNARPAIQNLPASISDYDNILIGYPIWWHTAPMIIGTFLENYDLNGIDVYPFTQSASMNEEQFKQSMDFVRSCAGSATVHDGLFAKPSDTSAITSYLDKNGLTK